MIFTKDEDEVIAEECVRSGLLPGAALLREVDDIVASRNKMLLVALRKVAARRRRFWRVFSVVARAGFLRLRCY